MSKVKRITVSLDESIVNSLTRTSRKLGVSRSGLLNLVLSESVVALEALYDDHVDQPDVHDARRLRGASLDLLSKQYTSAVKMIVGSPDLFGGDE